MKNKKNYQAKLKVALVGNPNCGKTTLFNVLTGSNQHIGNWPGVTVSLKAGRCKKNEEIELIDLPGIYGLAPISLDEVVSRDFILNEKPDVILNVVDATNLERSLYLTSQLMALDVKVVIAVNMCDEAEKLGITIDTNILQEKFGCDVIKISAKKKEGIEEMLRACLADDVKSKINFTFSQEIEEEIVFLKEKITFEKDARFHYIKLVEKDKKEFQDSKITDYLIEKIQVRTAVIENLKNDTIVGIIATQRYNIIHAIVASAVKYEKKRTISDKIDRIVTNKWLAFPIFAIAMWLMFFISIQSIGGLTVDGMTWIIEKLQEVVTSGLVSISAPIWLISLLVDGIIAGVGAVVQYVPQIMILFGLISLLEACGYMARVAYVMDALLSKIGLSGKSFIPMIIGCGCSVPAIMGARTIKNPIERNATIMLVPFVPCSAKLPIFALFTTMVFGGNALAATSMYFIGILMVVLGGLILKFINRKKRAEKDAFVMELPPYRIPAVKNIARDMWERGKAFLIKAGTIIFIASVILWFLQSFNFKFQMVETADSILASIGKIITPLFVPLGFGQWELVIATLTGVFAKETVVATMEILGVTSALFTGASAYSFMVFNLLFFPCLAAVSASFKELGSKKLGLFAMIFQTAIAYLTSMTVYWFGVLFLDFNNTFWIVLICAIIAILIFLSIYVVIKAKKKHKCSASCATCVSKDSCNKLK